MAQRQAMIYAGLRDRRRHRTFTSQWGRERRRPVNAPRLPIQRCLLCAPIPVVRYAADQLQKPPIVHIAAKPNGWIPGRPLSDADSALFTVGLPSGFLAIRRCHPQVAERGADLQRRAAAITLVDECVEDAKQLLPERER